METSRIYLYLSSLVFLPFVFFLVFAGISRNKSVMWRIFSSMPLTEWSLERKARAYFELRGWRANWSVLCSFAAIKDEFVVYVLAGAHVRELHENPSHDSFKSKIQTIKAGATHASPIILVVTRNAASAVYYEGLATGPVAVIAYENLALIDSLDFATLHSNSEPISKQWALSIIGKVATLSRRQSRNEKNRGDTASARRWAEHAVSLDSNDATSHYILANLQYDEGDLDEAEKSSLRANALRPRWEPNIRLLSEIALRRGNIEASLELAQDAVRSGGEFPDTFHHLALINIRQKNLIAAKKAAEQAVRLDRNNPAFRRRLEEIGRLMQVNDER